MPNTSQQAVIYCDPFAFSESKSLCPILINNQPWFVAIEVCKILDLSNPTESLKSLDDDEKLTSELLRAGQTRKINLVNESGLYNLIFRSNKAEAKAFRKWVTAVVLPQIRQTGGFGKALLPQKEALFIGARSVLIGHKHTAQLFYTYMDVVKKMGEKAASSTTHYRKMLYPEDFITIERRLYCSQRLLLRLYEDKETSLRMKELAYKGIPAFVRRIKTGGTHD